jgi:peptidoglycan hydrolase-like protein with peptidoglycan-binding domain
MSLLRRIALGLLSVALVASAAVAAGYAMRAQSDEASRAAAAGQDGSPAAEGSPRPRPAPTTPAEPVQPVQPVQPVVVTPPKPLPVPPLLAPGDEGDEVRDLQARLKQLAWYFPDVDGVYGDATTEAVRGFQEKRGFEATGEVDPRTMTRLVAMTSTPTRAELHNLGNVPGALDARCRVGRVMCVDKTSRTIRLVVDGKVVKTMDVRFGGSATPTREGLFSVTYKSRDHHSRLYDTDMPFAMFFSGGQAVHYSPDFASVGYNGASHGCVNVRDYDGVAWLFDQVEVGDKVVVYWS